MANATVTKIRENSGVLFKIHFSSVSELETASFGFFGSVVRVAMTKTGTDAAGTITLADSSGKIYFTSTDEMGDDIDYVPEIYSSAGNSYAGIPAMGKHTLTVTGYNGLTSLTVWIWGKQW